jgi:hypothetical protein
MLYPLTSQPAAPAPYPSSMTDQEWAIIEPLLARPAAPHGGRPPKHPLRLIVDAIRYLVRGGIAWRLLPGDFPPWQTVYMVVCQMGRRPHPGPPPRHPPRPGPPRRRPQPSPLGGDHRLAVGPRGRHRPKGQPRL